MDKNVLKNFVVGGALFAFAGFMFLSVESRGRFVESRVGMIGLALIATLIFLAAYLSDFKKQDKQDKPNE